jgi:hypothetical protein
LAAYFLGYAISPGITLTIIQGRALRILEYGLIGWAVLSIIAGLIMVIGIPRGIKVDQEKADEAGPWWPE